MEALGVVFLVLIAVVVLAAVVLLLVSMPDISRYRRLSRM
jgi:hypothetical protein